MYRGTTPTNTISVDTDLTNMRVYVTYQQGGVNVIEKTNEDITIETDKVIVTLTQAETLGLQNRGKDVLVQIRAITPGGVAIASNIMHTTVDGILKDGVIAYA